MRAQLVEVVEVLPRVRRVHRYGDTFERLVGDAASICHVAPVMRSENVSP